MQTRALAWWVAVVAAAAGARELDPAACASRFDVQRDKIIRTEESREMGARYLSELDVGARHECLRLCCETDACDVFVYEEKGPGSCYLFNCGPPEDFRCKFTAHSNFSSGVLALSRRLAELQDQEQRAHHERELANLRGGTSATGSSSPAPRSPPPPPAPSLLATAHAHDTPPLVPPRKCSRYQFECRRGGECIAVYNACDGVPQCADGSDEAPELGCPSPPPPPPPPPAHAAPTAPPAGSSAATHTPPAARTPPLPVKTPLDSVEMMSQGLEGLEALAAAEAPGERWPHRLAQAQPHLLHSPHSPHSPRQYPGAEGVGGAGGAGGAAGSHIFSHKGGLLTEVGAGAGAGGPYAPFEPPWPRRGWPQSGADGMSGESGWGGGGGYTRLDWPEPDPRRAWPVPQHRTEPEMSMYLPAKTMPEVPMVYSSQQQTLRDSPKKGFELNNKPESVAPSPASPPPAPPAPPPRAPPAPPAPPAPHAAAVNKLDNTLKHEPSESKSREVSRGELGEGDERSEAAAEKNANGPAAHAHHAAEERDGLSERPPAAVLLLVLGVCLTGATAAMLGCRARAARRRLRRGHSPFAHDADYLVNGMYL